MPGLEDEGKQIVKWLAQHVSKDLMVHIMEQYFPSGHVGKPRRSRPSPDGEPSGAGGDEVRYADINRQVHLDAVAAVKTAAQEAGLWRFVEAARHGGFNI
jgi:putative pyruvate formate lyase activating enzyme